MKKWRLALLLSFTLQAASAQWEWLAMDFEPGEITDALLDRESENDTHCLSTLLTSTETAGPAAGFGLSVFPNPTTGPVQLRFELPSGSNGRLIVFNPFGQEVASHPVRDRGQVSFAPAVSGVYFALLEGPERGVRAVTKFLIQ